MRMSSLVLKVSTNPIIRTYKSLDILKTPQEYLMTKTSSFDSSSLRKLHLNKLFTVSRRCLECRQSRHIFRLTFLFFHHIIYLVNRIFSNTKRSNMFDFG